jgi:hypothetical protein
MTRIMSPREHSETGLDGETSPERPRLPEGTHLHFAVLDVLVHRVSGASATEVRESLRAYGEDRAGPKFYQMMGRIEQWGLVESWTKRFDVGGSEVSRTFYRVTPQGRAAWRLTLEFYALRLQACRALLEPNKGQDLGASGD